MSGKAKILQKNVALACVLAAALAGCTAETPSAGASAVIAWWGSRGRIDAAFVKPRVIDVLPGGNVVVIDRTGRVQTFDPLGVFVGKFALAKVTKGYPTGMAIGPEGNLWIGETHAYRVGVYTPGGNELFAFGRCGTGDGEFVYVSDVAVSPLGKVYVSDYGGPDRVQEFDIEGHFVRVLGAYGLEAGQFRRPQALACAADGSLLVADAVNHRIQKFSAAGVPEAVYGSPGSGQGQLYYPYDIAVSDDQTVYIAEYGNCRVQRMTLDGEFTGTWNGDGAGTGGLVSPWGVAVDGRNLYVLDTGNSRVLRLDIDLVEWSMQ